MIGEVVPHGFEKRQGIGEATNLHKKMKSLTSLVVSGCYLDCLPQGMGQLVKLSELMLKDNKRLVKLFNCIKEMKSLTWFDVGGCDLDCLPKGIW